MIYSSLPRFSIRPTYPTSTLQEEPCQEISAPFEVYDFYNHTIAKDPTYEPQKEHLVVVAVDFRNKLIGYNIVSVGTANETLVNVAETLRPVIVSGSSRFFLIHNHPSGDPAPSLADKRVTKKVQAACELLDMHLVDHIIMGDSQFYSFQEHGNLH